jgi:hypothetical protein
MSIFSRYTPAQEKFRLSATCLGLASLAVLDELFKFEDGKIEKTPKLNFLKDSFAYYCDPKSYNGKTRVPDLLFIHHEDDVILGDSLSGNRSGARQHEPAKKLLSDICSVLDPSLERQNKKDSVSSLIGFFTSLQKIALQYNHSPPSDIPLSVRTLAAKLAKR